MRGTGNRVKKKSKSPDQKKQSQLFVETARIIDAEEDGKKFDNALGSIFRNKKAIKKQPDK